MKNKIGNNKFTILSGVIGIIAVLITIASDIILLGRPVSTLAFLRLGTESMSYLAQWRIILGTFAGVFALPFQIAGVIPLYYGLKPAGGKMAGFTFCTAAYTFIMGVAFHISYAFIGSGWHLYKETGVSNKAALEIMSRYDLYWNIIIFAIAAGLLASSLCYAVMILTGKTLYPKWMSVLNPVFLFILIFVLLIMIPEPYGGYIGPAYMNISVLVFFVTVLTMQRRTV